MSDSVGGAVLNISADPFEVQDETITSNPPTPKTPMWAIPGVDAYTESPATTARLPAGLYRFVSTPQGLIINKVRCDTDKLIALPDTASEEVMTEIKRFWKLRPRFLERGLIHKRGVLMMGPPGSGKTATVQQLIQTIITEYDGIAVFLDHPTVAAQALQMIRRVEPDRPIIALMEDFDALLARFQENEFLSLLDGESQVSNIVFVATTNYPEKLDRRFIDRPSRFDLVIEVGMPSPAARAYYLQHKETSLTEDELDEWVDRTAGFSIAHLRELIVLTKVFDMSLDMAVTRLEAMRENRPSSENLDDGRRSSLGFTGLKKSRDETRDKRVAAWNASSTRRSLREMTESKDSDSVKEAPQVGSDRDEWK
jgi:hypothetical protein